MYLATLGRKRGKKSRTDVDPVASLVCSIQKKNAQDANTTVKGASRDGEKNDCKRTSVRMTNPPVQNLGKKTPILTTSGLPKMAVGQTVILK